MNEHTNPVSRTNDSKHTAGAPARVDRRSHLGFGGPDDELLSINETAALVRAPVATLRYWRHLGTGPHSFRVGRAVRYWRSDVMTWLQQQHDVGTTC